MNPVLALKPYRPKPMPYATKVQWVQDTITSSDAPYIDRKERGRAWRLFGPVLAAGFIPLRVYVTTGTISRLKVAGHYVDGQTATYTWGPRGWGCPRGADRRQA
jgi:hypothetical protein